VLRLVADDADGAAVEPGEPDDEVLGVVLVDLEELPVVDHVRSRCRARRRARWRCRA
jgi:hypothetical protein